MPKPVNNELLKEFFQYSKPKKKPCSVGFALSQLKPADKEALQAALATDSGLITGSAIVQWLQARDLASNYTAVSNHRRGGCTCVD